MTAIKLPTTIPGLVVIEADDDEAELITRETDLIADAHRHFYSITTSTNSGYVVAGVVTSSEDAGDFNEASELWRPLP